MLYKNDQGPLVLSKAEKEAIEKYFHGKFPVRVIYPPERVVKSRLKHNRKPDQPNSISFDLKAVVKTNDGTEIWRYADNVTTDGKGNKKYTPKKFIFNGSRPLKRTDIELIFFLLRKSEFCKGGDNQGPMPKFMFEDLITKAEKKAMKKELENKVGDLIYNKDGGMTEEKLRAVATVFCGISKIDDYSLAMIKNTLSDKVLESDANTEKFFDMVNKDEEINTRVMIQKVIDSGVIKLDDKRVWRWQTKGDQIGVQSYKVPPNETPQETLYNLYKADNTFREDIKAVLLTRNPNAGKAGKKKEEEVVVPEE